MKRVVAFLLALLFAYALIGCVAGSTQVSKWHSTVKSLNSYLQSYKVAPYRSEALKYGEKAEKSLNRLAKSNPVVNSEFVSDYLNTNTLESLINDYNMIAHCTIVRYGRLNDNTQAWIKQVSSGLWKALQEHYNVKPTTLYQICTTDEGAFYSENPDAQPKEAKETVREVVAIDENGKNIYESKENITTVSYYGDYAIAHISKWKFGGGSYGWNNGKFYDKADKWTNDKIERVYFKGGMIFESYSGEEKTTPFLFIDGILLGYHTSDLDKNDKYIWVAYPKELRPKY